MRKKSNLRKHWNTEVKTTKISMASQSSLLVLFKLVLLQHLFLADAGSRR